ncbi:protein translocase subunit SecA-like [Ptychodera flava]|uniref:protein translocase subunit SecA-like n=1 Tax=Ptychodera flava TaxID=63121 RepID=UPI00396A8A65
MVSWVLLLLAEEHKGRLIEIATGEGKSCIIAMAAAMLAILGNSVDIVTSSPLLAKRDSENWKGFYTLLNLSVGQNIDKIGERLECYRADIVYGTVGTFAADILWHEFEQREVNNFRAFDAVIVDEVDFMLLDHGVQFTYLNDKIPGLRHLEPVLAMVWSYVSQYKPVESNTGDVFFTGNPKPFHQALAELLNPTESKLNVIDPLQLVCMAEQEGLLRKRLHADLLESTPDQVQLLLEDVGADKMKTFFDLAMKYIPYVIRTYVLQEDGKIVPTMEAELSSDEKCEEISFLLTTNGMCFLLHGDKTSLEEMITESIGEHLQLEEGTCDSKIIIQGRQLRQFVKDRLPVWVANAFAAMKMTEGRHYLIKEGEAVPVDYSSTGMIELNKRWGDGLQQFVEMKHRLPLSQMSLVTNFMSNIFFFRRYSGLYGVSGTLGSEEDRRFLQRQFNVDFCFVPTHRRQKVYEEEGVICANETTWQEEICAKVKFEIEPKEWRTHGRAVLVICEDINTATKVGNMIRDNVTENVILYTHSDNDEILNIQELKPGFIIVATNLAGRGTDIVTAQEVDENGGLCVLVTFLPMNTRIERQAFGRTGRKGKPGSAQLIIHPRGLLEDAKQTKISGG